MKRYPSLGVLWTLAMVAAVLSAHFDGVHGESGLVLAMVYGASASLVVMHIDGKKRN